MDYCLPGSPAHVISQARILEWVAILSSRGSSLPRYWTCISCFGKQFLYHWVTREVHIIYAYMLLIWITCLEKSLLSVCVVLFILIILNMIVMHLRFITRLFDIHIPREMMTTVRLSNISRVCVCVCGCVCMMWEQMKSTLLANFQYSLQHYFFFTLFLILIGG